MLLYTELSNIIKEYLNESYHPLIYHGKSQRVIFETLPKKLLD